MSDDPGAFLRRVERRERFTSLDNRLLNDESLSLAAVGLVSHIFAQAPTWRVKPAVLARNRGMSVAAVRKIIRELIDHGYCVRKPRRKSSGQMCGWDYFFDEIPAHLREAELSR